MAEASRSFEFSIAYQRSVLHRIIQDQKYSVQALQLLRSDHFDSQSLKWIFYKIKEGNTSVRVLKDELRSENNFEPSFAKAIAQDLISFLREFDRNESDYAIKSLRKKIDIQELSTLLMEAANEITTGKDPDLVRRTISKALFSPLSSETLVVDPISSYSDRFRERKETVDRGDLVFVSSGFSGIDEDIKGPRLGQFWVYFGDTNIGKSQAAVAVGAANLFKGYKTIHFGIEDLPDVTLQRYDSRFTKVLYDHLTEAHLTAEEEKIIEKVFSLLKERRKNHLYFVKLEEGATPQAMYAEYKRLQVRENFQAQVVVLDSPHDMSSEDKGDPYRLQWTKIYRNLRAFARKENVALIAFDQAKQKDKNKNEVADTNAFSESYDKARVPDGFITMNQSKIQRKDHIIQLFTAKMKDREKHRSYYVRSNFKICRYVPIENEGEE